VKRVLAVVAGIVVGALAAGVLAPIAMMASPERLRGAPILWVVMALCIGGAVFLAWSATRPRQE
jgi:hypothetical protein